MCAPLEAFLDACYHADNLPLRTPPDAVDNFGMVLQEMKVRKNSKDLRPVATPQAASCAAAEPNGLEQQMGFKMMTMMLEQAKALDSSDGVSAHSSSLVSPKALDTLADPLPLPAPAHLEDSGHGNLDENPINKDSLVKMTLEDYETEAKERLSKKKGKGVG